MRLRRRRWVSRSRPSPRCRLWGGPVQVRQHQLGEAFELQHVQDRQAQPGRSGTSSSSRGGRAVHRSLGCRAHGLTLLRRVNLLFALQNASRDGIGGGFNERQER